MREHPVLLRLVATAATVASGSCARARGFPRRYPHRRRCSTDETELPKV